MENTQSGENSMLLTSKAEEQSIFSLICKVEGFKKEDIKSIQFYDKGNIKSIQFYDKGLTVELKNGDTASYTDADPSDRAECFINIDQEKPITNLDDAWLSTFETCLFEDCTEPAVDYILGPDHSADGDDQNSYGWLCAKHYKFKLLYYNYLTRKLTATKGNFEDSLNALANIIKHAYGVSRLTITDQSAICDFPAYEDAIEDVSIAVGFEVKDTDSLFDIAKRMTSNLAE